MRPPDPWVETWADFVHEWRAARPAQRVGVVAGMAAAALRILLSTIPGGNPMRDFGGDVRLAVRRLWAAPMFTLFSVLTLAAGLTATVTVQAVLHYLAWRSPAIHEPDRLADLADRPGGNLATSGSISLQDWRDYVEQQQSFQSVFASMHHSGALGKGPTTQVALGESVFGEYFEAFGVSPRAGRFFGPADYVPDAPSVIVLSESAARRLFGEAEPAVGVTVPLGGESFTVVGVAPSEFPGMASLLTPATYWIPLHQLQRVTPAVPASLFDPARRDQRVLTVRGRLKASVSVGAAAEEARVFSGALEAQFPTKASGPGGMRRHPRSWTVQPTNHREVAMLRGFSAAIMVGVVLVMVLACTNLANLGFSRITSRQGELQVRSALGASRWRLIRAQLAEASLVLGAGIGVSVLAVRASLVALHLDIPIAQSLRLRLEPTVTPSVVAVAMVVIVVVLVVIGLWPVWRVSSQSRAVAGPDRPRWRVQRRLIAAQVAGSVALMMVTVSALQSVTRAVAAPGVDLHSLGIVQVNYRFSPRDDTRREQLRTEVLAAVTRVPGIEAAAASVSLPFGTFPEQGRVSLEPIGMANASHNVYLVPATAQIWQTLNIPFRAGVGFSDRDVRDRRRDVIVISEFTARAAFGSTDVIGRQLYFQGSRAFDQGVASMMVVGVTADTDTFTMGSNRSGLAFIPFVQQPHSTVTFTARAEGDPEAAVRALTDALRRADPDLAIEGAGTGWTMLAGRFYLLGALSWLASSLTALTLILVMSGLYGVLSAAVIQRWRELGVRMALGCTRGRMQRLIFADGASPAMLGLIVGLGFGLLARAAMSAILPSGMTIVDPAGLVVAPLVIAIATISATWWPARRAASVDPSTVLRDQ